MSAEKELLSFSGMSPDREKKREVKWELDIDIRMGISVASSKKPRKVRFKIVFGPARRSNQIVV